MKKTTTIFLFIFLILLVKDTNSQTSWNIKTNVNITATGGNTTQTIQIQNIPFIYYNITPVNISIANVSAAAYKQIITLNITQNKQTNIECVLTQSAALTTTGIQYIINVTGSTDAIIVMTYYSSATATAVCSGALNGMTCAATGSSGAAITPVRIFVNTVASTDGILNISAKSELANGNITIYKGSWCRSTEW